ncbi:MAG: glucosidase, partial [Acaryochloris sp. RU_4_1]|nr:glucosidase [Acaryochloris sp. RU_4_1]
MTHPTVEEQRLQEAHTHQAHWRRWGPYLSDRQWGTVREDYSADGNAWNYLTHDQARSRAYRWGEDGLFGISDNHQRLCFAIALWNGEDPILKERLFGLTGNEGNHGEDVKEYYFYLDNTPTHSYMKALYKYPQQAFPYDQLVAENQRRSRHEPEFELLDTGVLDGDRYFDVFVEYAKYAAEDILVEIKVINRGPEAKTLHVLPTLWFRNTWSWSGANSKPVLQEVQPGNGINRIGTFHPTLGKRWLYCQDKAEFLFTENETNTERLFNTPNASVYVKDGINDYIVQGCKETINPAPIGTKAASHYILEMGAGETKTVRLRLSDNPDMVDPFGETFNTTLATRQQEAHEFYQRITPFPLSEDMRNVQRQAFAGMLWSKQFYHYVMEDWLKGDPAAPAPPPE